MAKAPGIRDLATSREDMFHIDPRLLKVKEGWNSRDVDFDTTDETDLTLANSIAAVGVRRPLTIVYEDGAAFVTDGHRRLAATMYAINTLGADIKSVPVVRQSTHWSEADRILNQIVMNDGKPLKPLEFAAVVAKLLDHGYTIKDVAEKTGRSQGRIKELISLRKGPAEVVKMVQAGEVSASMASKIVKATKGQSDADRKAVVVLKKGAEAAKKDGRRQIRTKDLGVSGALLDNVATRQSWMSHINDLRDRVGGSGLDDAFLDRYRALSAKLEESPDNTERWFELISVAFEGALRAKVDPAAMLRHVRRVSASADSDDA